MTTTVISFFNEPIAREQTPFSFAIRSSLVPRPQTITVGIITTTVFFLPISIPANVPVATAIPVLPTTVYVKNGVAQPFSEAQFPELRSLTIGTVKATTFAYTETGGSASPTIIVDVTVVSSYLLLREDIQADNGPVNRSRGILLVSRPTTRISSLENPCVGRISSISHAFLFPASEHLFSGMPARQGITNNCFCGRSRRAYLHCCWWMWRKTMYYQLLCYWNSSSSWWLRDVYRN